MKSILIIGLGRFGRHMAETFLQDGHSVLAVDISEERADMAIDIVPDVQIGDATNELFLKSLGVSNFDLCVVAIGENFQHALITTVLLRDLGAKFIVGRATRDIYKNLLLRNGADYVMYAEREMAERLAVRFGCDNIFDYIELTDDVGIYEIAVPDGWVGKSIIECSVRAKYNVTILAVKEGETIRPVPSPDHVFDKNERLMIMGEHSAVKRLTR